MSNLNKRKHMHVNQDRTYLVDAAKHIGDGKRCVELSEMDLFAVIETWDCRFETSNPIYAGMNNSIGEGLRFR